MLTLRADDIRLACRAGSWQQALDAAFDTLSSAGLVEQGYRQGLLDRESQSSTWLGNGIAIPHGTPASRDAVKQTGVRVLQFPEGVEWHDGNRVYVLVTIAAQSDEHLDILRSLTHVLDQQGVAERLAQADTAEAVAELLSKPVVRPRLDRETLCLGHPGEDLLELGVAGAQRLRRLGLVEADFVAGLAMQQPTPLGRGLWLYSSDQGVVTPALSLVTSSSSLQHQQQPVDAVLCLASQGQASRPLMDAILALLDEHRDVDQTPISLRELDADTLLARLAGESVDTASCRVRVLNAHGLHARPAKVLVQKARESGLTIQLRPADGGGQPVSATSLTKVIGLGARRGQQLVLSARGEGAEQALERLAAAFEEGLGEEVEAFEESRRSPQINDEAMEVAEAPAVDTPFTAVAASPGFAVAPIFVLRTPSFDYPQTAADAAEQHRRLAAAIAEGRVQLRALIESTAGGEVAAILSMHEEMLSDPELEQAAVEGIHEGLSAEAAWWRAIDTAACAQEQLADRLLAERAADLRDVGRRVLGVLCDVTLPAPPSSPYILVTDDIGPSDVARLDTGLVRGIMTARGGATAHSAILARALGIPAVVGAGDGVLALANGAELLLDGESGRVVVEASAERRDRFVARMESHEREAALAWESRFEPAMTADGTRIEVVANLGNTAHARDAVSRGAEGIGLLRTEFLFMAQAEMPDVEAQQALYREALDALDGRPLVARTLDVGGDKPLSYWPVPREDNPFLGLRGIRLALTRPQVLRDQFCALIKAAEGRPLRIMLPMVKDVAEFRAARQIFDEVIEELAVTADGEALQLGVMIEIPSSALLASTLAAEVDFFSVGTNDLTQYTLAIDRGHPQLSAQSDGLHPAVLKLIEMTVQAAHAHGKWVGVCGELASDRQAVPVLLGLGVDELSVSARQVPMVKTRLRGLTMDEARRQAQLALAQPTAEAVRSALEDQA
ncbi:PTS fructose transporter subunit FruI [Halomonas cupida]|uniref:phosphoenolpyruvate--protein phosphotransferase n=1 Tax=Halomonas cupida TaxID=44933 RepID=A0A1M7LN24_9GAMM|nr:phosphoenolpyruvate--protein phosphotransferase [Halomonas cupida]GEN25299.1 PTS fructose transporter subunit FruI [Halomonas cupida]SHM79403.1 phosphocarrier protein FPr [Halomonas cupida]